MSDENIYERIQKAISSLPENFSVLEEQIDINLQMKYFSHCRDKKYNLSVEEILIYENDLYNDDLDVDLKKDKLVILATQDKVEAFRAIEKYSKNPHPELKAWSILALQESRMLIQSSLLDEQQVFISTGLGGKDHKLRYFVALVARESVLKFSEIQKKIIQNEFEFAMNSNDGEIEDLSFYDNIAISVFLLPIKTDIQSVFLGLINEINQYGDFLHEDIVITNVKIMTPEEIVQFISQNRRK